MEIPVAVVMVPLAAQGHLNQLLHLSCLLSARGLPIHYVGSATHNRQAQIRVHGWDPLTISNIHFHDLPFPPFSTPPPDPDSKIKFPDQLQPVFEASTHLYEPLSELLHSLSTTARRLVLIHDSLMAFCAEVSSKHPNCDSYVFHSTSAVTTFFFWREEHGDPEEADLKLPELPHLGIEGCFSQRFAEFIASQMPLMQIPVSGHLFNTCYPVEAEFIDFLTKKPFLGQNLWAIGPLNPITVVNESNTTSRRRHQCLEWLGRQPPKSVIYISFGTTTSISNEQIFELAVGLERSGIRFCWVLREADRGDIFANKEEKEEEEEKQSRRREQLPEGYEKRNADMGLIVRDWAPQLDILAHPSVGGFVSHCGWNSCMESMSMGVPIAAWPMHSDQPMNALLVTSVLKIGVMAREWDRWEEVVAAEAVEGVVRRLMEYEEGKEMRQRAEKLGDAVRGVWSEGGISLNNLDSLVRHFSKD